MNWIVFYLVIILFAISIVMLNSLAAGNFNIWAKKQLINCSISAIAIIAISCLNSRFIKNISYLAFAVSIALLIYVWLYGKKAMGAARWISIGGLSIQPSEFAKLASILFFAKYFDSISIDKIGSLFWSNLPMFFVLIQVALIVNQPDLATSIVVLLISVGIIFGIGAPFYQFIIAIVGALIATPIAWSKMRNYQKLRVLTFINPERDPMGSGYNAMQSKIAIGSGGIIGKGLQQGTQTQLNFLPEKHTDFIFTSISEELGLIWVLIIILIYIFIIVYAIYQAIEHTDIFYKVICIGCSLMLSLHIIINIAMVSGLMPVAGIPLPFLSYGGSSGIVNSICIGLILNAGVNRKIL